MPSRNQRTYASLFYQAAEQEIGLVINLTNDLDATLKVAIHRARPKELRDYSTIATPNPRMIYIVKPGVTLD